MGGCIPTLILPTPHGWLVEVTTAVRYSTARRCEMATRNVTINQNKKILKLEKKKKKLTSHHLPPRPITLLRSFAKFLPSFSSSILLAQSSRPVQMRTCWAYTGMTPLRGDVRSMSSPSGVGVQGQVGEGHVGIVGKGGFLVVRVRWKMDEGEGRPWGRMR